MKNTISILIMFVCFGINSWGQDKTEIERAALDYLEGFYEGDTIKIQRSVHPDLSKLGYGWDKKSNGYKTHIMTYDRAVDFARDVLNDPKWAAPKDAIKKIEILDAQDKIACVKVTAYWGIDYLLLSKYDDAWMITKVLWQSPDH